VATAESKFHGLNFCQGTVAEMLKNPREEIYDVIRYFGSRGKINIQGGFLDFRESFIDDGDMDMLACLRVYREIGFEGMIMPDHVPSIPIPRGSEIAFAYTFGYINAAIRQVWPLVLRCFLSAVRDERSVQPEVVDNLDAARDEERNAHEP
jgi:mannonate dehydratase